MLGSPVGHSLSPLLHRAAYDALGLTGWTYDAVDVDEQALAGVVGGLDRSWAGLSLTMPLKQAVLPLLDEMDETVRTTGACNTVVVRPDGPGHRLAGANTDVDGIARAICEVSREGSSGVDNADGPGVAARPQVSVAHVLGGGATAASAVLALRRLGCPDPVVHVRDPGRAGAVLAVAERCGCVVDLQPWPTTPAGAAALAGADVVVATTPAGSTTAVADALPGAVAGTLLDVAYQPWPSALAARWSAAGGAVAPGSLMLLHQAAVQVHLMTGLQAPLSAMRVALAGVRSEIGR